MRGKGIPLVQGGRGKGPRVQLLGSGPIQREAIAAATFALLSPTLHLRSGAQILAQHEALVAATLGMEPVQTALFPDFPGQTKSLGAWGGDFILATGNEHTPDYFVKKGFKTVIPYREMVL